MRYWGKLVGLVLGSLSGGGFVAIVAGLVIGHFIDKVLVVPRQRYFSSNQERQSLFFLTTYQVMGHLTKSKGRVTDVDIRMATLQMDRMQLHGKERMAAQQAFREGKQSSFPLRKKLRELKSACFGRFDLIRMFLEIQIQAAFANGQLHPKERQVLHIIAEELGISQVQFEQFLRMMAGGQQFGGGASDNQGFKSQQSRHGNYQHQQHQYRPPPPPRGPTLQDACSVLGVKPNDDDTTIKRAYRKLMSEHHPDKLVAKGLPPQMMELAKQKAQKIQAAYDLIRKKRGLK